MKKALSIALCFVVLITLCSCKPSDIGSQAYKLGKKAVAIADEYLDYNISASEAYAQIQEVEEMKDTIDYDISSPTYSKDYGVCVDITLLSYEIMCAKHDSSAENYQAVLERRNEIAEMLGMSAKK